MEYVLNSYSYKFGISPPNMQLSGSQWKRLNFYRIQSKLVTAIEMRIHMTIMLHYSIIPSKLCVTVGFHIKLVYADCMNYLHCNLWWHKSGFLTLPCWKPHIANDECDRFCTWFRNIQLSSEEEKHIDKMETLNSILHVKTHYNDSNFTCFHKQFWFMASI